MKALLTDTRHSAELAAWAAQRIPHVGDAGFGPCWAVGVASAGVLEAVVVFHDWQPRTGTVQLSMASASPRWVSKPLVGRILGLAFVRPWLSGEVRKVWVAIPSTAARVVAFNEALGLRREAVLRHHAGDGVHVVVCSILKREWQRRYAPGGI